MIQCRNEVPQRVCQNHNELQTVSSLREPTGDKFAMKIAFAVALSSQSESYASTCVGMVDKLHMVEVDIVSAESYMREVGCRYFPAKYEDDSQIRLYFHLIVVDERCRCHLCILIDVILTALMYCHNVLSCPARGLQALRTRDVGKNTIVSLTIISSLS
ncbi:hypothetical protein Tco_1150452 [Tanacetum coccineum]